MGEAMLDSEQQAKGGTFHLVNRRNKIMSQAGDNNAW